MVVTTTLLIGPLKLNMPVIVAQAQLSIGQLSLVDEMNKTTTHAKELF